MNPLAAFLLGAAISAIVALPAGWLLRGRKQLRTEPEQTCNLDATPPDRLKPNHLRTI
jgi:hypothetical protein